MLFIKTNAIKFSLSNDIFYKHNFLLLIRTYAMEFRY